MSSLSVIVPSRNERFLPQTIDGLLANARGDIEVIAILDGYWPAPPLRDDKRLRVVHFSQPRGMRAGINAGAAVARGEYLMKCDGHCLFGEGFDEILKADCEPDWIVIPRRYSLDAETWTRREDKTPIDYEYLRYPYYAPDEPGIHGTVWPERGRARKEILVDENMAFQGSCWFMPGAYFERFGGMSEEGYGTFIGEPQEIGNKAWLSGGRIMTNKKTWYAHLHKGKVYGRGYSIGKSELIQGNRYSVDYWVNNKWPDRKYDLAWLVKRFWPVPTWPDDWEQILYGAK
jgi:glycosyltransferase involved in cell wall biosynthesis